MLCQKNEYQKRKKLQKQKKKTLLIEKTNNIFKGFLNPIHLIIKVVLHPRPCRHFISFSQFIIIKPFHINLNFYVHFN